MKPNLTSRPSFTRTRVALASALSVATLGMIALQAAAPAPAQAAWPNDLRIKNAGSIPFGVCKSWTHSTPTASTCGSSQSPLPSGTTTSSYLGWSDTDAILVPNGSRIYRVDGGGYIAGCNRGANYWMKLSPGLIDADFELRREYC